MLSADPSPAHGHLCVALRRHDRQLMSRQVRALLSSLDFHLAHAAAALVRPMPTASSHLVLSKLCSMSNVVTSHLVQSVHATFTRRCESIRTVSPSALRSVHRADRASGPRDPRARSTVGLRDDQRGQISVGRTQSRVRLRIRLQALLDERLDAAQRGRRLHRSAIASQPGSQRTANSLSACGSRVACSCDSSTIANVAGP